MSYLVGVKLLHEPEVLNRYNYSRKHLFNYSKEYKPKNKTPILAPIDYSEEDHENFTDYNNFKNQIKYSLEKSILPNSYNAQLKTPKKLLINNLVDNISIEDIFKLRRFFIFGDLKYIEDCDFTKNIKGEFSNQIIKSAEAKKILNNQKQNKEDKNKLIADSLSKSEEILSQFFDLGKTVKKIGKTQKKIWKQFNNKDDYKNLRIKIDDLFNNNNLPDRTTSKEYLDSKKNQLLEFYKNDLINDPNISEVQRGALMGQVDFAKNLQDHIENIFLDNFAKELKERLPYTQDLPRLGDGSSFVLNDFYDVLAQMLLFNDMTIRGTKDYANNKEKVDYFFKISFGKNTQASDFKSTIQSVKSDLVSKLGNYEEVKSSFERLKIKKEDFVDYYYKVLNGEEIKIPQRKKVPLINLIALIGLCESERNPANIVIVEILLEKLKNDPNYSFSHFIDEMPMTMKEALDAKRNLNHKYNHSIEEKHQYRSDYSERKGCGSALSTKQQKIIKEFFESKNLADKDLFTQFKELYNFTKSKHEILEKNTFEHQVKTIQSAVRSSFFRKSIKTISEIKKEAKEETSQIQELLDRKKGKY